MGSDPALKIWNGIRSSSENMRWDLVLKGLDLIQLSKICNEKRSSSERPGSNLAIKNMWRNLVLKGLAQTKLWSCSGRSGSDLALKTGKEILFWKPWADPALILFCKVWIRSSSEHLKGDWKDNCYVNSDLQYFWIIIWEISGIKLDVIMVTKNQTYFWFSEWA
jgi:hypothetical protein